MLLITSGAYVESELASEFGRIPPAFLPVGNRRLYTYQVSQFGGLHERICLTVPDDFRLDEADTLWLRAHQVDVLRTTPGATLGAAVHEFLCVAGVRGPLHILYGDTLITDPLREGSDWLAVGHTDEYYEWYHEAPSSGQPGGTWTGLFAFSDATLLRAELEASDDFIAGVRAYDRRIGGLDHWTVSRWLDFGHVHTYFDSKRIITTQRHFNQLRVADGVVTKSGSDSAKIMAEASWFEEAPAPIKPFLAPYICRTTADDGNGGNGSTCAYQLEYLHLATLNELYVFGRLPERVWRRIFGACDAYLRIAASLAATPAVATPPCGTEPNAARPDAARPDPAHLNTAHLDTEWARQTYLDKTLQRLTSYAGQAGVDLDAPWTLNGRAAPPLRTIAEHAGAALLAAPPVPAFLHGDFCFSNILFDFRAGRVKMVDPRGTDALGRPSRFGDLRYDLGKLAHSVLGLYDFIVAGFYLLRSDGQALHFRVLSERCLAVQRLFAATPFAGRRPSQWQCHPAMVLLFLSMLPLHADDPRRQQALMANGIRLYLEWTSDDRHPDGGPEPALS
jgi:hypothetical protein